MSETPIQAIVTQEEIVAREKKGQSYLQLVWRKFRKSRTAILGGVVVGIIATLSVFAPFFSPYNPLKTNYKLTYMSPQRIHFIDEQGHFHFRPFVYKMKLGVDPHTWRRIWTEDKSKMYQIKLFNRSWEYKLFGIFPSHLHLFGVDKRGSLCLLGTDQFGRDLWSRILLGGRVSLLIGLFGALLSVTIGSTMGVVSGYYGGIVDMVIQRLIEFLQCFPQLPLWMALSAAIPSTWSSLDVFIAMILMFSLLSWTVLAREVRGKVLSYRDSEFAMAAKEMGASDIRIIFKHLLPNSLSHIVVVLTVSVPQLILMESTLSFFGLGIQPPMVSWGTLLQKAIEIQTLGLHPWIMFPGLFIIITVLGFNFVGDGLRDAADPYSK